MCCRQICPASARRTSASTSKRIPGKRQLHSPRAQLRFLHSPLRHRGHRHRAHGGKLHRRCADSLHAQAPRAGPRFPPHRNPLNPKLSQQSFPLYSHTKSPDRGRGFLSFSFCAAHGCGRKASHPDAPSPADVPALRGAFSTHRGSCRKALQCRRFHSTPQSSPPPAPRNR